MVLVTTQLVSQWILALTFLSCGTAQSQEAYPNPFAGPAQPAPAAGAAAQQYLGGQAASPQPDAYPNPFKPPGSGNGDGAAVAPKPASPDPKNAGGTCCSDLKKTFQISGSPQPVGGCCAPGNKWGCNCQDGGSFLYNPLACPVLHRNTRITPSGPRFELFCNVQTRRKDIKVDTQDSFLDCVDACGALAGCVGADFAKNTKECHYKSEYMDENTDGAPDNDVDSASMPPPLKCPQARK